MRRSLVARYLVWGGGGHDVSETPYHGLALGVLVPLLEMLWLLDFLFLFLRVLGLL